ncbi:hypothetical protein AB0A73_21340 [Glycomyces sp. NPDC047369]
MEDFAHGVVFFALVIVMQSILPLWMVGIDRFMRHIFYDGIKSSVSPFGPSSLMHAILGRYAFREVIRFGMKLLVNRWRKSRVRDRASIVILLMGAILMPVAWGFSMAIAIGIPMMLASDGLKLLGYKTSESAFDSAFSIAIVCSFIWGLLGVLGHVAYASNGKVFSEYFRSLPSMRIEGVNVEYRRRLLSKNLAFRGLHRRLAIFVMIVPSIGFASVCMGAIGNFSFGFLWGFIPAFITAGVMIRRTRRVFSTSFVIREIEDAIIYITQHRASSSSAAGWKVCSIENRNMLVTHVALGLDIIVRRGSFPRYHGVGNAEGLIVSGISTELKNYVKGIRSLNPETPKSLVETLCEAYEVIVGPGSYLVYERVNSRIGIFDAEGQPLNELMVPNRNAIATALDKCEQAVERWGGVLGGIRLSALAISTVVLIVVGKLSVDALTGIWK